MVGVHVKGELKKDAVYATFATDSLLPLSVSMICLNILFHN